MTDRPSLWSYVVNGAAVLFGAVTFQEFLTICGLLLGLATFLVNAYYKRKDEIRKQEVHDIYIERSLSSED
jgi:positive regulator of sigma E activity